MLNVLYFSIVEVLCGFSPNFTFFLVMRALFGIGMGGEWGVGASLVMEAAPVRLRGILSGILQAGYSIGYLLAAVAARFLLPAFGWRAMFWAGAVPALLALYIRTKVPESEAWRQHRAASTGEVLRVVAREWKRFAYLVALMTFFRKCTNFPPPCAPTWPLFTTAERSSAPSSSANSPKWPAGAKACWLLWAWCFW
jgi:SHS family lactate transporter-like MFS transporter